MQYLSQEEIKNKRVILRCDFNVPVKDGKITDDTKIIKSYDTIDYLLKNNNQVIILSHFGRIKKEEDKNNNSLNIVYEYLKKRYDLEFIKNPLELEPISLSNKKCFLVENTRYTDVPLKKESDNDLELAKYWANFADVFVIDAFASLHRAHTSTAGISKYLKTYLGFLVEKELTNLNPLIDIEKRPFLVIMGGAKVDDKIKIIKGLLEKCDKLLITGGILNTFLSVKGFNVGKSLISTDESILTEVSEILDKYKDKIMYTEKFIINRDNQVLEVSLKDIKNDDIIYDNIIDQDLNEYKMFFVNGTCGKYEDDNYKKGTMLLFQKLKESDNAVYIGGGDSVSAINNLGFNNNFTYLSSGGGATLEYVAYNKLKALEFIKENNINK